MTEEERNKQLKSAFAGALLREFNPFKAGVSIFPADKDLAKAIQIANEWPNDEFVIAEQERLLREVGVEGFLPNKAQVANELYKIGTDPMAKKGDRVKALEAYSAIMGYVQKPSTAGEENDTDARLPTFVIKKYKD